jgi:hypothetical protein
MVDVDTVLVAFLEDFWTWNHFRQLPKYQDFWSVSTQIKGILLYCIQYKIEFVFVT